MKVNVNLLQESQKIKSQIGKYGLIVQSVSFLVLIIFGVMAFLVLSYRVYLGFSQENLTKKVTTLQEEITELKPVETKYTYTAQRISLVSKILRSHEIKDDVLMDFYDALRGKVGLDSIDIFENQDSLKIMMSASNAFVLENVVQLMAELDYAYKTLDITSEDIHIQEEKGYETIITVSFTDK